MSIKILTKNAVENTNIDGARDNNFNSGRRSGIVKGALNQGNLFQSSSNIIALDTCELRLCGHRIVIESVEYKTLVNTPSTAIRYSLVAQVIVDDNKDVSFDLIIQSPSTSLVQENLDITGKGKFQLELGRFTQQVDGTITDIVRTADLITGGIGDAVDGQINIGNVTTNTLEPGMEAEVDVENRYDEKEKKTFTDFSFSIPKGAEGKQGDQGKPGIEGNGISNITKTSTVKLVDTYTINFTNGDKTQFQVSNGKGIVSVTKTNTDGLIDTYTILFNDDTTSTFTITNGAKGDKGDKGDKGEPGESPELLQSTGTSTTATMSQKAITDNLNGKVNYSDILQATGANTDRVMSQNATTTELNKKLPLSGGTLTGNLLLKRGNSIRDSDGNILLYSSTYPYNTYIGNMSQPLLLQGSNTRPTYYGMTNGVQQTPKALALYLDIPGYFTTAGTTGSGTSGSLKLTLGHMYRIWIVDGIWTYNTFVKLSTDASKAQSWFLGIGPYGHYMRLNLLGNGTITYSYVNVGNTNWTDNLNITIYYEDITSKS